MLKKTISSSLKLQAKLADEYAQVKHLLPPRAQQKQQSSFAVSKPMAAAEKPTIEDVSETETTTPMGSLLDRLPESKSSASSASAPSSTALVQYSGPGGTVRLLLCYFAMCTHTPFLDKGVVLRGKCMIAIVEGLERGRK